MSIATWEFESPPLHIIFFVLSVAKTTQLVEHNLAPKIRKQPWQGYIAEIAQLVEHNLAQKIRKQPWQGYIAEIAQLVEHNLAQK